MLYAARQTPRWPEQKAGHCDSFLQRNTLTYLTLFPWKCFPSCCCLSICCLCFRVWNMSVIVFSTCFRQRYLIQIIGRIINSVLFCGPKSALSISIAYLSVNYYIVESVSDWMIDWICNFLVGLFFSLYGWTLQTRSHIPWKITGGRWQSRRMYWSFTNFKTFPCWVLVLTLNLCEGQPLLLLCVAQWPYSITLYNTRF